MIFDIRPLELDDYDTILVDWWKDWGWTPPTRDFLPDNGKGGMIVLMVIFLFVQDIYI